MHSALNNFLCGFIFSGQLNYVDFSWKGNRLYITYHCNYKIVLYIDSWNFFDNKERGLGELDIHMTCSMQKGQRETVSNLSSLCKQMAK